MTYYKVLLQDLRSFSGNVQPTMAVQYKVGEYVYPRVNGTYLMVFDNLESAKSLKAGLPDFHIYECECESVCEGIPSAHQNTVWPKGTKFAYGVGLTKKVEEFVPQKFYMLACDNGKYILVTYTSNEAGKVIPDSKGYMEGRVENDVLYWAGTAYHLENWKYNMWISKDKDKAYKLLEAIRTVEENSKTLTIG